MSRWFNLQFLGRIAASSIVLASSTLAFALPAPEVSPEYPARFFIEASYFDTTANFDVGGGSYTALGNGRSYKLIEGRVGGEYWMIENVSVFGQLGYGTATSNDGFTSRNRGSLTEALLGTRFLIVGTRVNWAPEFWLAYPLNKFDEFTDEAINGEGVMKIFGGAWGELAFGNYRPFGRVGFLYQDDGRASLATYEVGFAWKPADWRAAVKIYGTQVVIKDEHSDERYLRDLVTSRVNGGSWKFYSVDPEILAAQVQVGIPAGKLFRVNLGYDRDLNGKAAAAGWTALAGLEFLWPTEYSQTTVRPERRRGPLNPSSPENDELVVPPNVERRFEPDSTKYDEALFTEPESQPKPQVIKRKIKPKVRQKPPKRRPPTRQQIDQSLEDVQKSLEK